MKNLNDLEVKHNLFNEQGECVVDCDTYANTIIGETGLPVKMHNTSFSNNHEFVITDKSQLWGFVQHPNAHINIL